MRFIHRTPEADRLLLDVFGPPTESPTGCRSNILADESHPDALRLAQAAITGRSAR